MMALRFDIKMLPLATVLLWISNVAAKSVCYPGLGCFDDSLGCNSRRLPQSPSEINTKFYLYTPENPQKEDVIDWTNDASIINSHFFGSRETKFIIHGFTDKIMTQRFLGMKDGFLSTGKFNVILVNWKDGADLFDLAGLLGDLLNLPIGYLQARQNARLVGRQVGELSRKLQRLKGASFKSMHLIGHSLGAHVAGFAGEHLSGKYGRITGLDPAGPGYQLYTSTPGCLLEKSDAIFVDIIHTDGILGNDKAGNFNVILVNWKNGADLFDLKGLLGNLLNLPLGYEQSRQNTRLVGRQIGLLSRKLQQLTGASFTEMHLVGRSLGAHLAGFAGEYLSGHYGRISGLDPAGPGFEFFSAWPGCLLEKSDAIFVDIIHTDDILGNDRALGHQDFYPSGGRSQVSCDLNGSLMRS